MKKLFIILFMGVCLHTTAQRYYNEDGKYYEFATVDFSKTGNAGRLNSGYAFFNSPSTQKGDSKYRDENGKVVDFWNFASCISYFSLKGWTILDINSSESFFIIRREIPKEEAEKLVKECVKD
jgi:hypothetical protein